jgi:hypothetical protein
MKITANKRLINLFLVVLVILGMTLPARADDRLLMKFSKSERVLFINWLCHNSRKAVNGETVLEGERLSPIQYVQYATGIDYHTYLLKHYPGYSQLSTSEKMVIVSTLVKEVASITNRSGC